MESGAVSYIRRPAEKNERQLRSDLAIAQAHAWERAINDIRAELAARAVAGTPEWQARVRPA